MSDIKDTVKEFVIDYFTKYDCEIKKIENGYEIFDAKKKLYEIIGQERLKITFSDIPISGYETISPGSRILHSMMYSAMESGPVVFARFKDSKETSSRIRFNFYVLLESNVSENYLETIDVDINSNKILPTTDIDLEFISDEIKTDIDFDGLYISATDEIEKRFRNIISEFRNRISENAEDEAKELENNFKQKIQNVEEKSKEYQSLGISGKKFDDLIEENKRIKQEFNLGLRNISQKFEIILDYALVSCIYIK